MGERTATSERAPESPVEYVGDVSDDHRGWLLEVKEDGLLGRRQFVLGKGFGSGVRRWTHEGVEWVGLTDDQRSPGVVGTERMYRADTPCKLVRPATRKARAGSRG